MAAAAPKRLVSNISRAASRSTSSTWAVHPVAGVVDQAVDRPGGEALGGVDRPAHLLGAGHVELDRREALGPAGAELRGHRRVADARDHAPAGLEERVDRGPSDSAPGAGDERRRGPSRGESLPTG